MFRVGRHALFGGVCVGLKFGLHFLEVLFQLGVHVLSSLIKLLESRKLAGG
jgi:hypothetical protein